MGSKNNIMDLFNVNGLVAVVTGGGTGLGLYAARALDANGAKAVYIIGRREEILNQAAKTGVNGTIKPIVGDVTDKSSLIKAAEQIKQEHGYINLLFANAGIFGPDHSQPILRTQSTTIQGFAEYCWKPEMEAFTQTSHVNTTGVFYTVIAFLELLDAGNKTHSVPQDSQIIVTSSLSGISRKLTQSFAYSTSKAGVAHLAKILSTTFAEQSFRIRVNTITPGPFPTELSQPMLERFGNYVAEPGHEGAFSGAYNMPAGHFPAERSGSEEEFAGAILFLASKAGAYMNGDQLVIDGGRTSVLPATY